MRKLIVACVVAFGLSGCASLQHDSLQRQVAGLPRHVEQSSVPFYPQEKYQCGPAALAMAFAAAGVSSTADELRDEVFIPAREGSLQIEMQAAPRRHGLVSLLLKPRLDDLLTELAAGQPVLVLQNLALDWYPLWHYAVAIGYDLDRDVMILRSGTDERAELPMRTFEHTWARSGYWAMLVLPPDRLPRTVSADDYVTAVTRLESAGSNTTAAAARRAYSTALQRWPDHLAAQIGAGNTAYADHDLSASIDAYRRAAAAHPDSSIAFNNLAQALADAGRTDEALAAAHRAVELDGAGGEAARRTLAAIMAKDSPTKVNPAAIAH